MKYPRACTIIVPVEDEYGDWIVENGKRKESLVPGYILSMALQFNAEGRVNAAYEVVDMTGKLMWMDPVDVIYEISDVHERFRALKQ